MIQNETDFRIACGCGALFFALCLTWLLEACLADPASTQIVACCSMWRSLQLIPYLLAVLTSGAAREVNLPVFWLLFGLQWFLFGTIVISRVVNYFRRITYLLKN